MKRLFIFTTLTLFISYGLYSQSLDLIWAKHVGGSENETISPKGITYDTDGNIYITGWFQGTVDFDPGPMTHYLTSAGFSDIFVCKLNATGDLFWARSMGGEGTAVDGSTSIAVDSYGNVYTTGKFDDIADFDPGDDTYNLTSTGYGDIFVSKLDPNGHFLWAKSIGGESYGDIGLSILIDALGDVHVGGQFYKAVDFDPGPETYFLHTDTDSDLGRGFLLRLNSSGDFISVKKIGGRVDRLTLDIFGNFYLSGSFSESDDFDPGPGISILEPISQYPYIYAQYICKLDVSGDFIWAKIIPNYNINIDIAGNIYTTGLFHNSLIFDFDPGDGVINLQAVGLEDIYIGKYDSNGNFIWVKQLGGASFDSGSSIAIDENNNIFLTGSFYDIVDFDPGVNTYYLCSSGESDIFISKYNASGDFIWAKQLGSTGYDGGISILTDNSGIIYLAGIFQNSVDFDPESGSYFLNSVGTNNSDIFVAKISENPEVEPISISCTSSQLTLNGQTNIELDPDNLVATTDNCGIQNLDFFTYTPSTISCSQIGTVVPVTIFAIDGYGNMTNCTSHITVYGLPCGWNQQPDGINCIGGSSASYSSANQVHTVTSVNCFSGIPNYLDAMAFTQTSLCGNGSITARVTSLSNNSNGWAGVIMRENISPDARKIQLMTNLGSLHRREVRYTTGGASYPQQTASNQRNWLRIVRQGNQFTAYASPNGVQWYQVMTAFVDMGYCIEMGLVVTNNQPVGTVTATFANVSTTGNSSALLPPDIDYQAYIEPLALDFSLFPNPTTGELNLNLTQYIGKAVRIEIYSLQGKLLQFVELPEVQAATECLNLSEFSSGMYIVRVKTDGLPAVEKRVVTRAGE